MKVWVGVTDNKWFEFLSRIEPTVDEVNFWQPSGTAPFSNLPAGTPFLFKLKKPYNHIAGGGYFVKFVALPLQLAWDAFGPKNGAASLRDLDALIRPLLHDRQVTTYNIGCTVLTSPFFLPRESWIDAPDDWSTNIVRGKTYDTEERIGASLWRDIGSGRKADSNVYRIEEMDRPAQYGSPFLTSARLGQGTFRVLVTEAYKRRCAITGESILPVLEAAHIRPFSQGGLNNPCNGLLLRSDFHKLFDTGLVTVTPDLHIEVSPRIREEWFNGKSYYRVHGHKVAVLPDSPTDRPREDLLRWHNDNVYAG
jgi:putative restriction endonuclease